MEGRNYPNVGSPEQKLSILAVAVGFLSSVGRKVCRSRKIDGRSTVRALITEASRSIPREKKFRRLRASFGDDATQSQSKKDERWL